MPIHAYMCAAIWDRKAWAASPAPIQQDNEEMNERNTVRSIRYIWCCAITYLCIYSSIYNL